MLDENYEDSSNILDVYTLLLFFFGFTGCLFYPGDFKDEADGDKSVAYLFSNPYTGIIFEKTLMPLLDAIGN